MGTAPNRRQQEAMPDPVKLAGKSIRLLQRLGMTERDARQTVVRVVRLVAANLLTVNPAEAKWLLMIKEAAESTASVPDPSITDSKGTEHGDGTGSRAGCTASRAGRPAATGR